MKRIAVWAAILFVLLLLTLATLAAVDVAIRGSADLNDFRDPLLNAARDGDIATIDALLKKGMKPDRSDAFGNTPLTIAGHFGQPNAAEFLLKHGANVRGTTTNFMTPLQCAVYSRHHATAEFLLKSKADPDIFKKRNKWGRPALAIAANQRDAAMVTLLLDSGANIELADEWGWRPLHVALRTTMCSEADRLATVATLLEQGADPNAPNEGGFEHDSEHDSSLGFRRTLPNQGNTPLAIARSNGFEEIARILVKHGAK